MTASHTKQRMPRLEKLFTPPCLRITEQKCIFGNTLSASEQSSPNPHATNFQQWATHRQAQPISTKRQALRLSGRLEFPWLCWNQQDRSYVLIPQTSERLKNQVFLPDYIFYFFLKKVYFPSLFRPLTFSAYPPRGLTFRPHLNLFLTAGTFRILSRYLSKSLSRPVPTFSDGNQDSRI